MAIVTDMRIINKLLHAYEAWNSPFWYSDNFYFVNMTGSCHIQVLQYMRGEKHG